MTSPATGDGNAEALPGYAPIPRSALGPALNEQGYYVGHVERNLYWVTNGIYQSAFLTTPDGVVLFDAPPTIGGNLQRAGPAQQPGRCRRRRAAVAHGRGGQGVRSGQDVTGHRNTDSR